MQPTGRPFIGISGWRYAPWRGTFYPRGLPQRSELAYVGERLSSVEINGSFYSLQTPASYRRWRQEVPPGFVFSVKGGRYITHLLRLRDPRRALANFFASGVLDLGPTLGPLLWQLPATAVFDPALVSAFLDELPESRSAAAALAADHDDKLAGDRVSLEVGEDAALRHALEPRHESWRDPRAAALLREHDVALVLADSAGRWPVLREVTSSGFCYLRLHGDEVLYESGYTEDALQRWGAEVTGLLTGSATPDGLPRDVYVYFDNDAKVRAPYDALRFTEIVDSALGR